MLDAETYRLLGQTQLRVSALGLGTVKFGRNVGVKYPVAFELPTDNQLHALLAAAWDLGINFLDTAPAYGSSEERLGHLIHQVKRDWVIATKVGEYFDAGQSSHNFSATATRLSIEQSLRRLGREQLSLVYVHSDGNDSNIVNQSDVLPTLTRLKEKGDIAAIGFSGKSAAGSLAALDLVDVFMVALSREDESQAELIRHCMRTNKGVVIKKAMQSGHAANIDDALRFAVGYPGVDSVITGTINVEHLRENVLAICAPGFLH